MKVLSQLQVGTKLALVMTLILALVSLGIYLYFPAKMQRQAVEALAQRASAIADVTAFGLAPGLQNRDRIAVAAAVTALRRNPDLVFFVVRDKDGEPFAAFNEMVLSTVGPFAKTGRPVPTGMTEGAPSETTGEFSEDGNTYQTTTPIRYRGRQVGTLVVGFSLDRVVNQTSRSKATVALVTLLAFAVGVIAVFGLSTLITGPLHRIVKTAEQIAEGDVNRRADVESKDEVGKLARTFNLMLDRITEAREELEAFNRTLEQRVEERARELTEEITERRRAEERYRLLFQRNLAGVYIASASGEIISCNDACARLFGFEFAEDFIAANGAITYMNDGHRDSLLRRLDAIGAVFNEEVELRDRNERAVWVLENVRLVPGHDGAEETLEGILLDINDRKRAEEDIAFRAYHDPLTALPNRALFSDRVGVAMANALRKKLRVAVMFLDLDELKVVNDTLGHAVGDDLLKMVANRLTETLRQGDTVARVGGDEFVVLLPEINHEAEAQRAAQKILRVIGQPFMFEQDDVHITASIGVAIGPRDGATAEALIRNADGAMYRSKQSGGNRAELYRRVGQGTMGRTAQEQELRQAIDGDQFVVFFQPQVTIDSRELVGVEALVRWEHPQRGMIEPAGFITVAEHSGLITLLGEIVLRKALMHGMEWLAKGCKLPRISVNVSPRQLYQRNFVGMVERVLAVTGFDPHFLELELTESIAVQKSERIRALIRSLRAMGITIAVDDFGTGQSSLSYVKQFPVDTVKIDRSFVIDVAR
ncbi:MAG TPA: EAL domain-containing protein, partial [Thermoanaerobaculia bacterium]